MKLNSRSLARAAAIYADHRPLGFFPAAVVATASFFDAASRSHERSTLVPSFGDADRVQTARTRLSAMGSARALYANDCLTGGCINAIARYSYPLFPRYNTGDADDDKALDDYFAKVWAPQCDAAGMMSWGQFQKSLCILRRVDGDVGVRFVRDAGGFLRLRMTEAHRIGSEDKFGDRSYSDGVRLSSDGTPISYRIQPVDRTKPLDGLLHFGGAVDVPAAEFALFRWGVRPTAYRGFTGLARSIQHLHDRKDIIRYTKTNVKVAASIAMVLYKKGGAEGSGWDDDVSSSDATGAILAKLGAGQIPVLDAKEGEKLEQLHDSRPGPNAVTFLDSLAREVAVDQGVPYEFVWNPSSAGGTGMRTVNEQAAWAFGEEQDDFIQAIGNRVAALVALDAIAHGRVSLKRRPSLSALLMPPDWQRPPEVSIDRGQAKEDREDVATGNESLDGVASRRGKDWVALRKQIEREAEDKIVRAKRLAETHGISVELALDMLGRTNPNGTQPETATPNPSQK